MPIAKPAFPRLQRGHKLAQGLVHAFVLHENSGNATANPVDPRANGTIVATPPWIGSPVGAALSLNGSTQYIDAGDFFDIGTGDFSGFVFAAPVNVNSHRCMIGKRNGASPFDQWTLDTGYVDASGNGVSNKGFGLFAFDGSGGLSSTTAQSFRSTNDHFDGNFHGFGFSRKNGTAIKLYFDGLSVPVTAEINGTTNVDVTNIGFLSVGAAASAAATINFLEGGVAFAALWNRALSDDEHALLGYDPFAMFRSKLLPYNLYGNVDEIAISDADFIVSGENPTNDAVTFSLTNPPVGKRLRNPFDVRYRYRKTESGNINLIVTLKQGATQIQQWTHTDVTTSFQTAIQHVTGSEYNAITDWNDLRLVFEADLP